MRYIIILASGLADEPVEELGARTPLEASPTPALDEMAVQGKVGLVHTIPHDLPACEEVALLSIMGYDARRYFTGEAGLAAAHTDLETAGSAPYRFNLATEADGVLMDHAAGWIPHDEAHALLDSLAAALGRQDVMFRTGRGFSGVALLPRDDSSPPPPEDVLGRCIDRYLKSEGIVRRVVNLSRELFAEHEVNRVRIDLGENPANLLWLWGRGEMPVLPRFERATAGIVAAHESALGLGKLVGMKVVRPAGATGDCRTDYSAKASSCVELLHMCELAVIHVAAPAEASLAGDLSLKMRSIRDLDAMIVAPLLRYVRNEVDVRLLFLPTHAVSVTKRKRLRTPVPAVMFGPGLEPVRAATFSEKTAREGEFFVQHGHEFLDYFLRW